MMCIHRCKCAFFSCCLRPPSLHYLTAWKPFPHSAVPHCWEAHVYIPRVCPSVHPLGGLAGYKQCGKDQSGDMVEIVTHHAQVCLESSLSCCGPSIRSSWAPPAGIARLVALVLGGPLWNVWTIFGYDDGREGKTRRYSERGPEKK